MFTEFHVQIYEIIWLVHPYCVLALAVHVKYMHTSTHC